MPLGPPPAGPPPAKRRCRPIPAASQAELREGTPGSARHPQPRSPNHQRHGLLARASASATSFPCPEPIVAGMVAALCSARFPAAQGAGLTAAEVITVADAAIRLQDRCTTL